MAGLLVEVLREHRPCRKIRWGTFLFMVPSAIPSGFAIAIANVSVSVRCITRLNPLRYFMGMLRGVFLGSALLCLLSDRFRPLLVLGVAEPCVAVRLF